VEQPELHQPTEGNFPVSRDAEKGRAETESIELLCLAFVQWRRCAKLIACDVLEPSLREQFSMPGHDRSV